MKKRFLMYAFAAVLAGSMLASCSAKEESPEPVQNQPANNNNNNNNPPPPPPAKDTTKWFTDNPWVTKKVYKDGAEQTGHFLINSSYKFNLPDGYFFSIPNFPSASGTWKFTGGGKSKVELTNQGGTSQWLLLSINANTMVVETMDGTSLWKYEFSH